MSVTQRLGKMRLEKKRMPHVLEPSHPPRNDDEEDIDLNDFLADFGLPVLCGLSVLVLLLIGAALAALF